MHDELEAEMERILREDVMDAPTFRTWFEEAIDQNICPHCETPIKHRIAKGYRYCVEPCGCELFKVTLEPMKVVSLDSYRTARAAYLERKSENPGYKMPFKAYCQFRSRYINYLKTKVRQGLRAKNLIQIKANPPCPLSKIPKIIVDDHGLLS